MNKIIILMLFHALNVYASTAQRHIDLAQQYEKEQKHLQALAEYTQAVALEPHNNQARFSLGVIHAKQHNFSQAYEQFKMILERHPTITSVEYNAAYCLRNLGKFEQAIELYNNVIALEPNNGDAHQGKAHSQLALGEYMAAWPDFEYRWSCPRPDAQQFRNYLQTHSIIRGKKLALRAEFGLGDTLQFIRYAKNLHDQGAIIIVQAQKPLIPLLSLCPYIDTLISTDQDLPPHDLSTVLMSLPWTFNTTRETIPLSIPYLFADPILCEHWKKKLDQEKKLLKIGVCWNGNAYDTPTLQKLVEAKSIPLALIAQLNNKHIAWYSLQKISGTQQLATLPADFRVHRFDDFDESHGRFMDTAALMRNLDLVITVDTSIAHLAGGLGVKTWTLLPYVADWRWGVKKDDPIHNAEYAAWYPTMQLFRQTESGNWQTVIDQLKKALDQLLLTKKNTLSLNELYQQGVEYTQQANLPLALEYFQLAYNQLPTNSTLAHALASTHRKLNNLNEAAFFYRRALEIDPTASDSFFGLSLTLLAQGDNKEGWCYFNRWRSPDVLKKCPQTLQEVANKKVLILAEWGLGDMIHYMRYAQLLKKAGAYVILQTHPCLINLLTSCNYIDQVIPFSSLPVADYYIPLLYLPTLCKTTNETIPVDIPYLCTSFLKEPWLSLITKNKNYTVGLCWDIGHHDTNICAWKRSAPLENWLTLADVPHVTFYSLQKNGTQEINNHKSLLPIIDFGPHFDAAHEGAFVDSAAAMKQLHLVITVDTAVAHLAGALGVTTWVLLPYSPDYRWGLSSDSTPWYPNMRLFRQKEPGNWKSVFQEVKAALHEKLRT